MYYKINDCIDFDRRLDAESWTSSSIIITYFAKLIWNGSGNNYVVEDTTVVQFDLWYTATSILREEVIHFVEISVQDIIIIFLLHSSMKALELLLAYIILDIKCTVKPWYAFCISHTLSLPSLSVLLRDLDSSSAASLLVLWLLLWRDATLN